LAAHQVSARLTLATATIALSLVAVSASQSSSPVQTVLQLEVVRAIKAPTHPLPPESASAGVTKFSFLAYGDTRGRHDGLDVQAEHTLVVDSMLTTIRRLSTSQFPVKFVIQSGDAVLNGRDAKQWNTSYISIIDRLTTEAGVPYFFTAGNHDVTASTEVTNPDRQPGLKNLFDANALLIPAEGSARRLNGYATYGFGYGNTFLIAFDSNIAGDDTQFAWVKAQLEGLDRKRYTNVIAFMHHPPFSSGPHNGVPIIEPATDAVRTRYEPLFRQHHVRMTLAGHEHLFEHFVERYEDATGKYRMDHIVSGGGGAPLYAYQGEPYLRDFLIARKDNKVAIEHLVKPGPVPGDTPYHYVIVQVDGDDVQLDVVGVDWGKDFKPYASAHARLSDSGSIR